ncbi:MAG TPA: GNAT family N-acetyltransferase [Feifaniaceae bacterium]|nr:GNAT family N-acetyltransferase [Feifaniaceae bacterium]
MMKASHIFLRPDIERDDAYHIIRWLNDRDVTKSLHEGKHTGEAVRQALERCPLPTLTHLFNQDGALFMVCPPGGAPVGFLRLEKRGALAGVVVVIGEKRQWGRGMGTAAVMHALRHAFFTWRTDRVAANIHPQNTRSIRAFQALGFSSRPENTACIQMELTLRQYLDGLEEENERQSVIGE